MTATDLEYLLKERVVKVPNKAVLYLFVLDLAQTLQGVKPGNTISLIFSSNPYWTDEEVSVLPSPLAKEDQKKVEIELDTALKLDEIKIVYFNPYEVEEF